MMPNKYIEMYNYMLNFLKYQNSYNLIDKNYMIANFRMLSNLIHFNNILKFLSCNYFDYFKYYFEGSKLNNIKTNIANYKILELYIIDISFH